MWRGSIMSSTTLDFLIPLYLILSPSPGEKMKEVQGFFIFPPLILGFIEYFSKYLHFSLSTRQPDPAEMYDICIIFL